jgi:hypothetical protein
MNGSLDEAFVHDHAVVHEDVLENNIAEEYSRVLNASVFSPDVIASDRNWTVIYGLQFDTPVVSTAQFRDDILSFMLYREMFRNKLSLDNITSLAEPRQYHLTRRAVIPHFLDHFLDRCTEDRLA